MKRGDILLCKKDFSYPIIEKRIFVEFKHGASIIFTDEEKLPYSYIWDYFYTIQELRKDKLKKLENENR